VPGVDIGDTNPGNPAMPVILKVTQSSVTTDAEGLASLAPSSGSFSAPLEVDVQAAAGTGAILDNPLLLLPPLPAGAGASRAGADNRRPLAGTLVRGRSIPEARRKGGTAEIAERTR
jgi:hypothetical protein